MANSGEKRETAISMRFRVNDLGVIDRGAEHNGLWGSGGRSGRAALQEAWLSLVVLNKIVSRLAPVSFDELCGSELKGHLSQ